MASMQSSLHETITERPVPAQPTTATKAGHHLRGAAPPASTSATGAELRAHPRLRVRGLIDLVWRDDKQRIRSMQALARNVSRAGALVQCYRALPVGSFVRIRSTKLYFLAGCARVQHCTRRGLTYHIGLKFYSELPARYN